MAWRHMKPLMTAIGLSTGLCVATANAASAPSYDCNVSVEEWADACVSGARDVARAFAVARMRGASDDAANDDVLADAERLSAMAAHACANAERWSDALTQVGFAADAASTRAERLGRPVDAPEAAALCTASSAPSNAAAGDENRALDLLLAAERTARMNDGLDAACGAGFASAIGAQARLERQVAARRCDWLAEAGRARAERGAGLIDQGEIAEGLLLLSGSLRAYDEAQPSCSGLAREEVAERRGAIADLIVTAMQDAPRASREAREVRRTLFEERRGGFSELIGVETFGEQSSFVCHARFSEAELTAHQTFGLADSRGGFARDGFAARTGLGEETLIWEGAGDHPAF